MLNAELAKQGRDAGAMLAASKADRFMEGWSQTALEYFQLYANMKPQGFMTEDVRVWAEKIGFSAPPDNRAWGYVAQRARRVGTVQPCGYAPQSSSNCHCSPKTIWKKA